MNDELFDMPEQLSPYLEFIQRHGITFKPSLSNPDKVWAYHKDDKHGFGVIGLSEKEAALGISVQLNLSGWQDVNWS